MVATARSNAQGAGKTGTWLLRGLLALRRREKLVGVETAASGKTERRKKNELRLLGFIARQGARGIDTQRAPHTSAKLRVVAGAPGRLEKDTGGEAVTACSYLDF